MILKVGPWCVKDCGKTLDQVYRWVDEALELMRQSVKDPKEKARIVQQVIKIHGQPTRWGELMHGDTYGLGMKVWKARVDRVRIYYQISPDRQVEIQEITRRADAYSHGTVANRR